MDAPAEPRLGIFQPLPVLIVVLCLGLVGVEAVFQLAALGFVGDASAIGWRLAAMQRVGVSAPLFDLMLARREVLPGELVRVVAYGLVHASLLHTLFAVVLLLALGKAVSEAFSAPASLALMLAGLVAGALGYLAVVEGPRLLVGAYPAIYGLIGGFTWSLWRRAEGRGRLLAFRLVGVLIALQIAVRFVEDAGQVWVAEAAGFAAGFALAFVVAPDGGARLRRLRDRARG